jgi:hypothetical protein
MPGTSAALVHLCSFLEQLPLRRICTPELYSTFINTAIFKEMTVCIGITGCSNVNSYELGYHFFTTERYQAWCDVVIKALRY